MSLLNTIRDYFTPALTERCASFLGENEINISSAFKNAVPALLFGLSKNAGNSGIMDNAFQFASEAGPNLTALTNPDNILSLNQPASVSFVDKGKQLLNSLFGDKISSIISAISGGSGISSTSASSLLSFVTPLVMGLLGKYAKDNSLNAGSFASVLKNEQQSFAMALPPAVKNIFPEQFASRPYAPPPPENTKKSSGWFFPVLIILLALLAGMWLFRRCNQNKIVVPTTDTTVVNTDSLRQDLTDSVNKKLADLGAFFQRKLPNNIELNIPQYGIENKLVEFIEDKNKPVDKTTWFSFDRLRFESGSAKLEPESNEQLNNIAEILKAYPNVNIKIGGYTDSTGNQKANLELSTDRAKSVMTELMSRGIAAGRMEAEGYGELHPIADNSTEEGRAKNRRIDLRVTKK